MLNTNLPLMKRNIYHPAIGCSCGLHTWPTLLQSVCNHENNRMFSVLPLILKYLHKSCLYSFGE